MPDFIARGRRIVIKRPLVMGILNINEDSFCGDGRVDLGWAIDRAGELLAEGADIVDVGAESARTNRQAISVEEELSRLLPFVERFYQYFDGETLLSINTWRPEVAEGVLAVGGDILNDMGGLPTDANARICAERGAALLIMHSIGEPKVAHRHIEYANIMGVLERFFERRIGEAIDAGLTEEAILLDPGIDFAKQREDNLTILRETARLVRFGRPVLLPVSRKTVIGETLGIEEPRERDAGTIACIVAGARAGASIFRVHDVRAARLALETVDLLLGDFGGDWDQDEDED